MSKHHQDHNHDHDHDDHGHEHSHHQHDHGHSHHGHNHHFDPNGNKKGLTIALIITVGIMFLEFFGGLLTNSLALLSDSGHMLNDASSLLLSLVAVWFAARPASPNKTYGFYRFEILAALFNGITLFIVAGFIIKEAYDRFLEPPAVASGSMMLIASIGLLANIASAWTLMRKGDVKNNINLRSAYLHVLGDALGSVGAIVAGLIMLVFGWYIADPIISVLVALLILKGAWGVIKHTVHILMEGTPITVNPDEVKKTLESIDGVKDVHDLHIWTITSGLDSLSCHLLIEDNQDHQQILQQAIQFIADKFKIQHTTIQIETAVIHHENMKV
ncbi:cation transporter [Paenibacillus sp. H1-7]|uniref:cation diffusion facilitator family transporter n=1 Tax=Paenibacillus sp. H1-7 TaxID=2282849 RepID=UPI001EF89182|nr:cation diffusion facilitator family transporter [Paenibacillus sp. H1-7]ULL17039.1 cation transporter [Paenibacillus sp. H1-7]